MAGRVVYSKTIVCQQAWSFVERGRGDSCQTVEQKNTHFSKLNDDDIILVESKSVDQVVGKTWRGGVWGQCETFEMAEP